MATTTNTIKQNPPSPLSRVEKQALLKYLNMGIDTFKEVEKKHRLSVSYIGKKTYYLIAEIENIFEQNQIRKPNGTY